MTNIRRTDMPESCDDIKKLRKRLDAHIDEHRLEFVSNEERQLRQDLAYENNMKAIAELTKSTQGVVDAWKTASALQRFVKWLSGFAFLGAVITWLTGHFPFK